MKKTILGAMCAIFCIYVQCASANEMKREQIWDNPSMWYQPKAQRDARKLDVLYFVSTDVLSAYDSLGGVSWQSLLEPADIAAMQAEISYVESNMFCDEFNFAAPYYHQFTFDAIWQLDRTEFDDVYARVVQEACEAFDYYMANEGKDRPFILAGFSQGAMLTLDVLKHMTDEQYSRMVACYTMGYRLSAEDLSHPHIKAAEGETDRGVVISFNSVQNKDAIWPFVTEGAAACINPVNWKTDATTANFTYEGMSNEVRVDEEAHVLVVKTDNPGYFHNYYQTATFFSDAGVSMDNMHHWDLLFYSRMIHDNALKRAAVQD